MNLNKNTGLVSEQRNNERDDSQRFTSELTTMLYCATFS